MIKFRWKWLLTKATIGGGANGYTAMAFFIFLIHRDEKPKESTVRHEYIHFFQQLELLFVGMWLIYLLNMIYNLFKYKDYNLAYRNVIFEREAYANDEDVNYLINRKPFAFLNYVFIRKNKV